MLANRRRETPNEEFALIGLIPPLVTLKLLIMIIRLDHLLRENPVTLNHYPLPSNNAGFDGQLILRGFNNASVSTSINLSRKTHKPRIRTSAKFKIAPIDGEGDINHGRHQQTHATTGTGITSSLW